MTHVQILKVTSADLLLMTVRRVVYSLQLQ